ncbi:putative type IX sorting system protein PorV2 [Tenacibaculum maritimum]|uniref:putative type IX sorting system protein PorV2 n=1 Tax=Tenacibaculum maritimum TaxID=107401 RepID=UPI002306FF2A|nr:PorV/PorQ family protein [Tenacibaculum maritimum]MDB0603471.1 PorV/PorQ family protein [Tenacibaculum maritimum]MDB0612553.1 PorV/PorQ family protein [Tenacibaculum maritimum]
MKKIITSCILLIFPLLLSGQTFRNYSNEFLNIGVDAAALGMSKSVVATTNGVTSTYWNPAGLVGIKDYQGALMHSSYFAGIANYNYAGFAMPIDNKSALGLSIIRFGVDDILNTTELIDKDGNINFNRISLFSAADYAFNISYAKNLIFKNVYLGVNAKIIRRIIGDFASSWGFGFDLGIQFERNNWKIGLMARDITTTFNSWSINKSAFEKIKNAIPDKNQELPETTEITKPKLQLGIARIYKIGRYFNLLTEIDLNMRFTKTNDIVSSSFVSIDPALGLQLNYDDLVYLRTGIGNIQRTTDFDHSKSLSIQPNFGIGFKYRGIQIDYALTNIGSVGNALFSNVFSIKIDYDFFR